MRKRWFYILILSFAAAVSTSAQVKRTVTNDDLEKYRQKRVAAERDLRENYERLGFPSPEQLEKQLEKSRAERTALSARLRAENLEREQLDLERQRVESEARISNYQIQTQNYPRSDGYFYNYPSNGFLGFSNYGFSNNFPNNRFNRYGFGGFRRRYGSQLRIEYRSNHPVPFAPPRSFPPRQSNGGRRN